VFNWVANAIFRTAGPYITDSINGFRGLRRSVMAELALDARGYMIEYQMTIRAMKLGKKIIEFPTTERKRIGGQTKAPSIPTGLNFLQCLWHEL
jgi:hypothetical protein